MYQRTYSSTRTQLSRLWGDIVALSEAREEASDRTHFMGSLVLAPSPNLGPTGVQEFLVVDGQQRLTTLSILLAAIRDHRRQHDGEEHFDRINEQYLDNKWKKGNQPFKLLPTQADRDAYFAIVDGAPDAGGGGSIGDVYRFFLSELAEFDDPEDDFDVERVEDAIILGLAIVSVTTQRDDNAHRIFESLNNTGLKLTQGDLLRNYLFMRLPNQGEAVYHSLWLPLQSSLSNDELELLFWLDLAQSDPTAVQSETYSRQQARMDLIPEESGIKAEVERFARLGRLLGLILDPTREEDPDVRIRLGRLKEWGTATAYPLLLHLLDRRES